MIGTGDLAGAVVTISRHGPSFQVGTGANENNMFVFGASGWLDFEIISNPSSGPAFNAGSEHFDFNFELPNGPQLIDIPSCLTICAGGSVDLFATALPVSGSYTYLWSTGETTASISVSPASTTTYSVVVTDLTTNCTTTSEVTVTVNDAPVVTCLPVNGTCGNAGSASVDVTGGSGDYSFAWSNGATTASISNLADGPYSVTVTDNETGCSASCDFTITNAPAVEITCSSVNGSCGGLGSASVDVTSGTAPFTYSWTNEGGDVVSTDASASDLADGVYTVLVTDANGCTNTCFETIANTPAVEITCSSVNGSCGGLGSASVDVTSGTAPFTYSWTNEGGDVVSTDASASDLADGVYTVLVTDANGCTNTCFETIANTPAVEITCSSVNGACGELGSASVDVTAGTAPFTYSWTNEGGDEVSTDATTSDLADGVYTVVVTDANGCTNSCSETIANTPAVEVTCSSVNGSCGELGSASVDVTSGTAPFTYSWTNASEDVVSTDATASDLADGVYTVRVTDANGCTNSCSETIANEPALSISCVPVNGGCGEQGSASVDILSGTGPYTYSWTNAGGDVISTDAAISGLEDGVYSVTVTDANGCSDNCDATIVNQANLVIACEPIDGSCGELGSMSVNILSGNAPYTYSWTNEGGDIISSDPSISGLAEGAYTVNVTDANGCSNSCTSSVVNQPALSISCDSQNGTCGALGMASVSIVDGTAPYTYSWTNEGGDVVSTEASVSDLADGVYSVSVTDANGCSDNCSTTIANQPELVIACSSDDGECGQLGSASVDILSGTPPYTYSWSNGGTTASIENLSTGTYTVTVTDINECSASCSVTVNPSNPPLVDIACGEDPLLALEGTSTVENASGCNFEYAFWSGGLLNAYTSDTHWSVFDGSFVENANGTAIFTGTFVNNTNSDLAFDFNVILSGKTYSAPEGSPKENELCVGDIDNSDWYYYTSTNGTLVGTGDLTGAVINISRFGPSFQIGTGANLNDANVFGASGWLAPQIVSNPSSGPALNTNSGHLDFNISLPFGPQLVDVSPCTTICTGTSVDLFAVALPASGSYSYLWSTGETTASISVSPAITTTYSVVITDVNSNCSSTSEVTVTVEDCAPQYDCPDLQANIGSPCDDGDPNTINDTVQPNCGCEGTPQGSALVEGQTIWNGRMRVTGCNRSGIRNRHCNTRCRIQHRGRPRRSIFTCYK